MSDRIRPPATAATAAAASVLLPDTLRAMNTTPAATTAAATSFAEAQRRLADLRRQRVADDARQRAHEAATAAAQREAAAAARRARTDATPLSLFSPAASLTRLGDTAMGAWDRAADLATAVGTRLGVADAGNANTAVGARPAFRVSQVDAELLDEELLELLRGQVAEALQYVRGGTLQDDWQPEVMLVLRAALFKLSVWDNNATYGAALQNLRYADARGVATAARGTTAAAVREAVPVPPSSWQKAMYGLVTVGGRYAWTKWEDWLRDNEEDGEEEDGEDRSDQARTLLGRFNITPLAVRRLARATTAASNLYAGAAFVSFLVFLRYGRYRTVVDRVLRMRLVPPTSQVSREVSFEYLNRQLVWHAFTEFLLFLLPLVGIQRWRRWLTRWWRKASGALARVTSTLRHDESATVAERDKQGEYAFLPERTCAICYEDQNAALSEADVMAAAAASSGVIGSAETDITNPYEAVPCGCVYCYVSLATRLEREEGDGWTCLRCGTLVTSCRPWGGDVLEAGATLASTCAPATDEVHASRPSSSSTDASAQPGSPCTHKTVGFADDVKGDDDDDRSSDDRSSDGEIRINDLDNDDEVEHPDVLDDRDSTEYDDDASSQSEAYEEDEDVEGIESE